jgi:hypothetical protein
MVRIEGETVINRPVEDVFDFVADEQNEPRYNPQVRRAEQISGGPIGTATRFRAELVYADPSPASRPRSPSPSEVAPTDRSSSVDRPRR